MQTVFLRQIVLYRGCFLFTKHPVINQNFANLTVEECLINSFANGPGACDAAEHRPFTALPEHTQSVDVE